MLTRKGNLICKALVFAFAVITAMTMDSCCDDCIGGSKSNNNPKLIINNPKPGGTETSDEDKEKAGFKKTKDDKFWIFETPLFYSAKNNGKFYNVDEVVSIFGYIVNKYVEGYNSEINEGMELKVAILGDSGVGKTCIGEREVNNNFEEEYKGTIVSAFYRKAFKANNNKTFNGQIWDISGNVMYVKIFCKNIAIILLVFDVTTDEEISKYLDKWYNEIKNNAPEGAAIFVVGNKYDLLTEEVKKGNEKIIEITKKVNDWIKGN